MDKKSVKPAEISSSVDEESDNVFVIDHIVEHKYVGKTNRKKYLVRYKNCGPDADTWVKGTMLNGYPEILQAYWSKEGKEKGAIPKGSEKPNPEQSNILNQVSFAEIYPVEKIVKHRFVGKKTEYFVKWKGYNKKSNTWEPETQFNDDNSVLDEYWNTKSTEAEVESEKTYFCMICKQLCDDDWLVGPFFQNASKTYTIHMYCAKFSPTLERKTARTSSGIWGYSIKDLLNEAKRASNTVRIITAISM